jgi:hypothetical protein
VALEARAGRKDKSGDAAACDKILQNLFVTCGLIFT